MIAEIQCVPSPAGTSTARWAFVDAAIGVIDSSGLTYEVGPLGTSVEGPPDEVWRVMRAAHEACLRAGAASVVTIVKVSEQAGPDVTMHDLVGKFRR